MARPIMHLPSSPLRHPIRTPRFPRFRWSAGLDIGLIGSRLSGTETIGLLAFEHANRGKVCPVTVREGGVLSRCWPWQPLRTLDIWTDEGAMPRRGGPPGPFLIRSVPRTTVLFGAGIPIRRSGPTTSPLVPRSLHAGSLRHPEVCVNT